MANVLQYINTGTATSAGAAAVQPQGQWCRPQHKNTCQVYVFAGNTCCMCVPTTATTWVIEMWGQGGGGGGGCCCGVGFYGGQGGAYGWAVCSTGGQNHVLCACSCNCSCSTCTICSGTQGQFSRVCNCLSGVTKFFCVCGGTAGIWCCFPPAPLCCDPSPCGWQCSNTWLYWRCQASQLATVYDPIVNAGSSPSVSATVSVATAIASSGCYYQFCCSTPTAITPTSASYVACAGGTQTQVGTPTNTSSGTTTVVTSAGSAGTPVNIPSCLNNLWGNLCVCSCFSSPYVWSGACGWSDPNTCSTPFGCLNGSGQSIANATCGGGMGTGGASYAGGDQAWTKCTFGCGSCWVQCGNFPGGGGMTTWSQTAWSSPGCGAPGLIMMSWG